MNAPNPGEPTYEEKSDEMYVTRSKRATCKVNER